MAEERWKGVVQASSCGGDSFKNSSKYSSQVTVSLCFSPSNQTLLVMHAPLTYKYLSILFRFLGSLVHFVVLEINLPITLGSAFFITVIPLIVFCCRCSNATIISSKAAHRVTLRRRRGCSLLRTFSRRRSFL